jgi:hypothetical protein
MKLKTCIHCKEKKQINCFSLDKRLKDGHRSTCKSCLNKKNKIYTEKNKERIYSKNKLYRECNKDKMKKLLKKYYQENKEKLSKKRKQYYKKNKEKEKKCQKQYYKKNKTKILNKRKECHNKNRDKERLRVRIYEREKAKNNPAFKLKRNLRRSINSSLKKRGFKKNTKTEQILGCSLDYFKKHIESQFQDWQNWNNWGIFKKNEVPCEKKYWSIDHIIPLASAKTEEELIKLNHYTNLQVLDTYINMCIKRDRLDYMP